VWKLVATLFMPLSSALGPSRRGTDATTVPAARETLADGPGCRRLEALGEWLRGVLWDAAAIEHGTQASERADFFATIWPLFGTSSEEAAKAALAGGRTYLAALMVQPTSCVRDDLASINRRWAAEPKELTELVSAPLSQLFEHLSGERTAGRIRPTAECGWIQTFALAMRAAGGEYGAMGLPLQPSPEPGSDGTPPTDPAWHLLRLRAACEAHDGTVLKPLPTAANVALPTAANVAGTVGTAGAADKTIRSGGGMSLGGGGGSNGNVNLMTALRGGVNDGGRAPAQLRLGDYSFAWHLARVVAPLLGVHVHSSTLHEGFEHQLEDAWAVFVGAHLSGAPFDHTLGWVDVGPNPPTTWRRFTNAVLAAQLADRATSTSALRNACTVGPGTVGVSAQELARCGLDPLVLRFDTCICVRATYWAPAVDARLLARLEHPLPDQLTACALNMFELAQGTGAPLPQSAVQHLQLSRQAVLVAHATAAVRARSSGCCSLAAKHHLAVVRLGTAEPAAQRQRTHAWCEALLAVEALLPAVFLDYDGCGGALGRNDVEGVELRAFLNALLRTATECGTERRWARSAAAVAMSTGIARTSSGTCAFAGAGPEAATGASDVYNLSASASASAAAREERHGRWTEGTLAAIAAFAD